MTAVTPPSPTPPATAPAPPPPSGKAVVHPVPELRFLEGPQPRWFEFMRAVRIFIEAIRGFRGLHFVGPCVTVFGSARFGEDHPTYALGRAVGAELARVGFTVMTGGGPGVMEAANRGAHEMGAPTVGLNIALPHEQQANPYVTPSLSFKFHYFALRKMHFMMRAKALVAFPGGFGTLDELFEVITLVQTGKAKPVPIVLYGSDYWKRLLDLDVLLDEGAISPEDLNLFTYADDPATAWEAIRSFYALSGPG